MNDVHPFDCLIQASDDIDLKKKPIQLTFNF